MRTEKTNSEPRIRLGELALELVAPLVKPGEPVTKELMEAALQLKKNSRENTEHKFAENIAGQMETLTVLVKDLNQTSPDQVDDTDMKEVLSQLSQLNKYHSENIKHQDYLLRSMSAIATEVRSLKHVVGVMAGTGTTVEKELYEATLKGIDRMNQSVELFKTREGINIPNVEKGWQERMSFFENAGRAVDHEEEHEIDEKEPER